MNTPLNPRVHAVIRFAPPLAALIVAAFAVLVLIGWTLNIEVLKSLLHPGRIAMNPATAAAFLLCAAALFLLRDQPHGTARRRRLAWLFALLVIEIGASCLASYFMNFRW